MAASLTRKGRNREQRDFFMMADVVDLATALNTAHGESQVPPMLRGAWLHLLG